MVKDAMGADETAGAASERCVIPKCPECRQPMVILFRGGDLTKPFFGHRKWPADCKKYLDASLCSKEEAIRYPSERPKKAVPSSSSTPAAEKRPSKGRRRRRSSGRAASQTYDAEWSKNTLSHFGEPPGLDPNWTGD